MTRTLNFTLAEFVSTLCIPGTSQGLKDDLDDIVIFHARIHVGYIGRSVTRVQDVHAFKSSNASLLSFCVVVPSITVSPS